MHRIAFILGLAAAFAAPCGAAEGLKFDESAALESPTASRWQGRVTLGAGLSVVPGDRFAPGFGGHRLRAASVLGDYYFSPGFRASGGLVWGQRLFLASRPALGLARPALSIDRQWHADAGEPVTTVPYLGLGYTGLSDTGQFSFSADLGLVARAPGQAVRFGRVLGGTQNLDDLVRDLRLAPVLQLGVSYAF